MNAAAAREGIRRGMRRGEAEGICPRVASIERDRSAEMIAFESVVAAVEGLIPRVEIVEPGLIFVPVAGAVAYYGGEAALVERVVKEIDRVAGDGFRVGLADGPFAAKHAAEAASGVPPVLIVEDNAAFLAALDISAVGREEVVATLRWLGISTLGELARLPGSAVASRFGPVGADAHRIASGRDRAPNPREVPIDSTVVERFSPPLRDLDHAAFVARAMAGRLISTLASIGAAPFRIVVEAEAADGTVRSRTWRSADPLDDRAIAERVRWQLRAWVDGVGAGIRGGLVALRIEPADLSGTGRQLALGEDSHAAAETHRALTGGGRSRSCGGILKRRGPDGFPVPLLLWFHPIGDRSTSNGTGACRCGYVSEPGGWRCGRGPVPGVGSGAGGEARTRETSTRSSHRRGRSSAKWMTAGRGWSASTTDPASFPERVSAPGPRRPPGLL